MAEELVLTDPIVVPEQVTTTYKVASVLLDMHAVVPVDPVNPKPGLVRIGLKDNLGVSSQYQYVGDEAIDMMKWLNTANMSTKSMQKRILEKLSNDGFIPGTVTGTPDPPADPETFGKMPKL